MNLDALTLEPIREITDRAGQEGRIPSPDACDDQGQPLLIWEVFAALFGLTLEQAQAEEAEFDQQVAEVACFGPVQRSQ
ncbi:hypothetical protein [Candidatus Contendibacter odensensis]|uniref:Uncharacterized protein n=1 Tax=Candidatus Contendobacter odensis Run_B_J11 TaxID=1400861 RepID=A0A7U7GBD2_9GAMM|nr:hypothetical protein [Candidatus Contendobacter odensis]CDH44663.1 hypothetical protein BN874_1800001 [Candidatus Contendobacter odensis Run_B_J11]